MDKRVYPRKLVVAGLLTNGDGQILITQRCPDQAFPNQWEFPGGKVEAGEAPIEALRRELMEEIGASVHLGRIWDVLYHRYDDFELVMLMYHCWLRRGERVECRSVQSYAWCRPQDVIGHYDLLPADMPLIERLCREGVPRPSL